MKNLYLHVEIYNNKDKQFVFISTSTASGCTYQVNNAEDVGKYVTNYINDYIGE